MRISDWSSDVCSSDLADKIFVAANNLRGADGAIFSVVRYGNVLGSRGSVLPSFQRQIADGAPRLPITHPRLTRLRLTLRPAVALLLSALGTMPGGEHILPKLPQKREIDLAPAP